MGSRQVGVGGERQRQIGASCKESGYLFSRLLRGKGKGGRGEEEKGREQRKRKRRWEEERRSYLPEEKKREAGSRRKILGRRGREWVGLIS